MIPSVSMLSAWVLGQVVRRTRVIPPTSVKGWLSDSRNAVLIVLGAALLLGGGRKLVQGFKARKMLDRLNEPAPDAEVFIEAARHGRAAVMDLFRLLGSSTVLATRESAGRALSILWKADELITEEEKAIVSRGYVATWKARRRYPRAVSAPIPMEVSFGVPFLQDDGEGVSPADLEWSYRILGTERVSLEKESKWQPGPCSARFSIDPRDYLGNGPHRLVLQAKVRNAGASKLSTPWELELPHVPFAFEFDPQLVLESLFTLPDEVRGSEFSRRIALVAEGDLNNPRFLTLNGEFALRDPPFLRLNLPLPCDLAHAMAIEIEGCAGPISSGTVVLVGQGRGDMAIPLAIPPHVREGFIDAPGERRARAILTPDTDLGWTNPEIRSIWPEPIVTPWVMIRVVRI